MAPARRWPRRTLLGAAAALALASACGEPRTTAAPAPLAPYWEPALTVATGALDVLRSLELSQRAFAHNTLTADRFARAVEAQFESISRLAEVVVPLEPPTEVAGSHAHLVAAIDALVEVLPSIRAFRATAQAEPLVHVVTLSQRARSELDDFVAGIGPGRASSGLRQIAFELGEFEIDVRRVPVLAVMVGQFDDEAQARARLSSSLDDVRLSPVYRRWVEVGRFGDAASADVSAAVWRDREFETRIEPVTDLAFEITEIRPAVSRSWQEPAWLARLDFEPTAIASSAAGERIVAVSRAGAVAAFNADGEPLWTRELRMPLAHASVHPVGEPIAVHGFDVMLLDAAGNPVWPAPFRPDNQLIEQVLFDEFGGRLIVRSTNASGLGHVFAFDRRGQLWGPTKAYIGAAWVDFHPATGTVGVGSSKLGENQVVLIQPDGNLAQRFGVEGDLLQVIFTQSGAETIALTTAGMQVFDSDSGDQLWQLRFPADAAARIPGADVIVLAGPAGVGAFSVDGTEIWFVPGLPARNVLPTRNYVVAVTEDSRLSVIRSDGSMLGEAALPADLRSVAAAPDRDLLLAVSSERTVLAWQLPEPRPA